MHTKIIPDEIKDQYRYAIEKAREDRPRYVSWIQNEIETAIQVINSFDKLFVLGALGAKLIKATPTMYNQFLAGYNGPDQDKVKKDKVQDDDAIETLLEYAMSIALATPNSNKEVIPQETDIQAIYDQLHKIKINMNFFELSAENPAEGNEFDHWLRTNIMLDSLNVRGDGYHVHIREVYEEMFAPFDGFLSAFYGFDSKDIFQTIIKLDDLVYSKIGNAFGGGKAGDRLKEWINKVGDKAIDDEMAKSGKPFITQFVEANPDLYDPEHPFNFIQHEIDNIDSYNKIFWVIPTSDKEEKIFELLSCTYGDNSSFFQPPRFRAFPLNDSLIVRKPLIKEDGRYYHFSNTLAFRNIFKITEDLLKHADQTYYEHSFKNNSNSDSRDNYIEKKVLSLFKKLLPGASFFHSLEYHFKDGDEIKKTELDILGISGDVAYIIEVKAGELNPKHRRGAMKGLKDRISETINEGSYQCHRALTYIEENEKPSFEYIDTSKRKTLVLEKADIKHYHKISVTLEHFGAIAANLKYLVSLGILSSAFKWTWIISIYDLMILSELIESEDQFQEYLTNRMSLYDRNDIEFNDEVDILGFFFDNKFPLGPEKENEHISIVNYKDQIEDYYTKFGVGLPVLDKPKKKPIT